MNLGIFVHNLYAWIKLSILNRQELWPVQEAESNPIEHSIICHPLKAVNTQAA